MISAFVVIPGPAHAHHFWIQPSDFTPTLEERVDLELRTVNDGLHSYGEGIWFMHDHHEPGVTTDGINPGGDITMIVYESFLGDDGMPRTAHDLSMFFDPAFYRGEVSVWADLMPELYGNDDQKPKHTEQ